MPCCYRSERRPPADPSMAGCQFAVPETALIAFAGRTWCPFHLPFDLGGVDSTKRDWDGDAVAAFDDAVMAFVNMARAAGNPVDLGGVAFPGPVSFEPFSAGAQALPAIRFDGARFAADADFIEVAFGGPASFSRCTFDADADFIVSRFEAEADFSGAVFNGAFDAAEARFQGRALFRDCVFEGPAIFRETQFSRPPDFTGTRFAVAPDFAGATGPDGTVLPTAAANSP